MGQGGSALTLYLRAILLMLACLGFGASSVRAEVQRFAVVIGNNQGDASEQLLRYAESDAARIYEVFRDLGGFKPANMVLLQGQSARTVEETVIAFNERVRSSLGEEGTQALLVVYYSGHADGDAFHLSGTHLQTRLLSQLVSGSAATFRLLVLDACRSGVLTRKKGGRITQGSPLLSSKELPGHGLAVLAASAAHEDAQESDEIRGSYFTHALVSGLMGAADQDGDGAISLSEAYQYAYAATLRATSRTEYGSQHPTFRFDIAGQGAVVLTEPEGYAESRADLSFPPGMGFLVLRDDAFGAVVGELGAHDVRRRLSVKPGRYFVRGRGSDVLYEGGVEVALGTSTLVDVSRLARIDYARLVRKGYVPARGRAFVMEGGPTLRTAMRNANTLCLGGFVAYGLEFPHLGVQLRGGACGSSFAHAGLRAQVNAYDLELRLHHAWDLYGLTFRLGIGAGGALFTQRFAGNRQTQPINSLSPYLLVHGGVLWPLQRFSLGVDAAGETHLLRLAGSESAFSPNFALRASAWLGLSF